jgi:hypothetical protein
MKQLILSCLSALSVSVLTSLPALAEGQINVELPNGDIDNYPGVEISDTPDIIYFSAAESDTILMISKKGCETEDKLLFCNQARMAIDTNGVLEEIEVKQIVLFINPTKESLPIKGSRITMGPGTVLLEALTGKDSFITGLGTIDNNTKPAGASR